MKITYDPTANAVYIQVIEPRPDDGQTTVNELGVVIDVDALGRQRGFEFLCVREYGLPLDGLPSSVRQAAEEFIASGALNAKEWVEREYT